jgi:hypothetical protein
MSEICLTHDAPLPTLLQAAPHAPLTTEYFAEKQSGEACPVKEETATAVLPVGPLAQEPELDAPVEVRNIPAHMTESQSCIEFEPTADSEPCELQLPLQCLHTPAQKHHMQCSDQESGPQRAESAQHTQNAARQSEADREAFWVAAQKALQERNRREKVDAFLKQRQLNGVNAARGWFNYSYPLHVAVKEKNAEMVKLLLESGADRNLRDHSGRSARVLAKHSNKAGSHSALIKAFGVRKPAAKARAAANLEFTSLGRPEMRDAEVQCFDEDVVVQCGAEKDEVF